MSDKENTADLANRINTVVRAGLNGKKVTIVLVGPAGVGKSTLANTLLMKQMCRTGTGAQAVTENLQRIDQVVKLGDEGTVQLEVFDSPGFSGRTSYDNKVIKDLQGIANIDVLILCFDVSANSCRYLPLIHARTAQVIEAAFGKLLSEKKVVVALTKANLIQEYQAGVSASRVLASQLIVDWKNEFFKDVGDGAFSCIPVLPAARLEFSANDKPARLGDIDGATSWMAELWNAVVTAGTPGDMTLAALLYSVAAEACQDPDIPDEVIPKPTGVSMQKVLMFAGAVLVGGVVSGVVLGIVLSAALPAAATAVAAVAFPTVKSVVASLGSKVATSVADKIIKEMTDFWSKSKDEKHQKT